MQRPNQIRTLNAGCAELGFPDVEGQPPALHAGDILRNREYGHGGIIHSCFGCCRELGFLPVEVNASDTRNKSDAKVKAGIGGKLSNAIRELATNSAIGHGADGRSKRV